MSDLINPDIRCGGEFGKRLRENLIKEMNNSAFICSLRKSFEDFFKLKICTIKASRKNFKRRRW